MALRRKGDNLRHSAVSFRVRPQPSHHPVEGSKRQMSIHGDFAVTLFLTWFVANWGLRSQRFKKTALPVALTLRLKDVGRYKAATTQGWRIDRK